MDITISHNGTNITWEYDQECLEECCLGSTVAVSAYAIALTLLAILSTIENIVVLSAFYKHEELRSPSIMLFGVLAFIDLLSGAMVTPIKVSLTLGHDHLLDHIFWSLFTAVVFFSLATILVISTDAFLRVYFLERYAMTKRKMAGILLVAWLPSFVITICVCTDLHHHVNVDHFAVGLFFSCVVMIVVVYVAMLCMLKRHSANVVDNVSRSRIENERRAVKTTLIIVMTCIVMNLPPACAFLGVWSPAFCAVTFYSFLANAAVNPVLYCWRIPVMRKHVRQILCFTKKNGNVEESEDAFLSVDLDTNV